MMNTERIEERALDAHIRKRTVRLLDFTDKSKGGSGVAIQLANRFFIATAAHVIPKDHDIRILARTSQVCGFANWQLDRDNSDQVLLEGMSGCGIWMDQYSDGQVWCPEPALFAIQTGAKASEQWARGTQIKHWLRLVVQSYPKLADIAKQLR